MLIFFLIFGADIKFSGFMFLDCVLFSVQETVPRENVRRNGRFISIHFLDLLPRREDFWGIKWLVDLTGASNGMLNIEQCTGDGDTEVLGLCSGHGEYVEVDILVFGLFRLSCQV